jgi:ComF family protein
MITGFKFEDRFYYLPPLIEALQQAVLDHYAQDALPTALLAVPLHRHRQQHRGFNQAQMIAQSMKKKLAIPVLPHCVQRRINTPAQSQLSAAERHQNLRQAFFVKQPERIQQQHIVIIDDVLTTGSTVEALAKLLLQNGATRVDAWCLAKA